MTNTRLLLYIILILLLFIDFVINGFPQNLGIYKTIGLILLVSILVFLVFSELIKKKNKSS